MCIEIKLILQLHGIFAVRSTLQVHEYIMISRIIESEVECGKIIFGIILGLKTTQDPFSDDFLDFFEHVVHNNHRKFGGI